MPRVKLFDENEVLEKAMNLFWTKGYYATSVQDLVNHLGINRASLYDTFGGKKELFDKSLLLYRNNNTTGLRQFLNSHSDVKKGFYKLFMQAIKDTQSNEHKKGCFMVNTTIEFIPNDAEMAQVLQDNRAVFEKLFYDYLLVGVQQKQIPKEKNLKVIASLLFTFYNGLRVVTKIDFNKTQYSKSIDQLLTVLG